MLCDSELACARATRVRQQSTSRHALVGVVKRVTVQTGLVALLHLNDSWSSTRMWLTLIGAAGGLGPHPGLPGRLCPPNALSCCPGR